MFSNLIKSEARKSILHLLTQNSRQKYYLRELASMISYSPGSLQRELNTLVDSGFVVSEKMGNLRFFSLNTKSPFLGELKRYLGQHDIVSSPKTATSTPKKYPSESKNRTKEIAKKRDVLNKNDHSSIHSTIQTNTRPIIHSAIQDSGTPATDFSSTKLVTPPSSVITIPSTISTPSTPFSHIEPPTFSRPVLHKPHLEKPNFTFEKPNFTGKNLTPPDDEPPPATNSSDIEIHIE